MRTLCAITIQSQVVVLHHKALGSQVRQLARTLVDVKHRLTSPALEMMVVVAVGGALLSYWQAPAWMIFALVGVGMAVYGLSTVWVIQATPWGEEANKPQ